jgi:Flp pilus assembly protein TadD
MMIGPKLKKIGLLIVTATLSASCATSNQSDSSASEPPSFDQPQQSAQVDDSIPAAAPVSAPEKAKGGDNYQSLRAAVRGGNAEQIREESGKILSATPSDPVALNTLALYYFRKNKLGAAKLLIARAFEKNPDVASLYNNLGVIELSEGDSTAAIGNFKKALRLDNRHAAASGNLGSILVGGGEYGKSQVLLETAYRANRTNYAIANNYAISLRANKDYSKAARIYDEVVKASPRDVNALLNYSILLIDFMNKPKDGLALVYKLKFLETENRDIIARANALEKKAKAEIK